MKNKLRFLIPLFVILTLFTAFSFTAHAAQAESGVEYRISDDGTYVIIIGTTEEFPSIKIESEIAGLPVKEIAPSAFQNRSSLYSIEIPDSVTVIGEAAFRNCKNLVSVRLPSGLKELPMDAFRDCILLNGIKFPNTLEEIGDFCFQGCKKLGKLNVPASVKTIGYDAFIECESILLDVKDNAYAADYAEKNNINTEFKGTTAYFFLMMLLGTAVLFAVVFTVSILFKRHIKKHPTHNPAIYIGKAFSAVGRWVSYPFKKITGAKKRKNKEE